MPKKNVSLVLWLLTGILAGIMIQIIRDMFGSEAWMLAIVAGVFSFVSGVMSMAFLGKK